jgi:hypothetical protein
MMEKKNKDPGYQVRPATTLLPDGRPTRRSHFEILDRQAFKLENGLLRLIESLERKRDSGTWTETLIINESNTYYTNENPDPS